MNGILDALIEMNVAASAAILLLLLVRKPVGRHLGPHAAYLLWAIVPIAVAGTFIPARAIETVALGLSLEEIVALANAPAILPGWEILIAPALLAIWIAGAIAIGAALIRRQRAFMRDADLGLAGPAVVGFSYQRIVTPRDFARRFSDDERKLILTHEQVHLDRNDARINALVALARCLFWFNPLIHVGAKALRLDQELSCDAEVIDRRPRARRAYAETLLRTQLSSRPLPVGCYWPAESQHPLAERIGMLASKPLSGARRATATAIVLVAAASAGVAAWAAQPERTILREAPDVFVPFQPLHHTSLTTKPHLSDFSLPAIPAGLSLPGGVEVSADLCIGRSGRVESAELVKSSGYRQFDEAAVDALRASRFQPAMHDGLAIRSCGHPVMIAWSLGRAVVNTEPAARATP